MSGEATTTGILDDHSLLEHISAPDAETARVCDLRGLALTSVQPLAHCRSLQVALLGGNLLSSIQDAVFMCSRLRKLDLSSNGINVEGGLHLLDALASNESIQLLDLRHNHIHEQNPALEPRWAVVGGGVPVRPRVRLRDAQEDPSNQT